MDLTDADDADSSLSQQADNLMLDDNKENQCSFPCSSNISLEEGELRSPEITNAQKSPNKAAPSFRSTEEIMETNAAIEWEQFCDGHTQEDDDDVLMQD